MCENIPRLPGSRRHRALVTRLVPLGGDRRAPGTGSPSTASGPVRGQTDKLCALTADWDRCCPFQACDWDVRQEDVKLMLKPEHEWFNHDTVRL